MFDFIKKLFKEDDSGSTAKKRLKVVIFQDRSSLNPEVMNSLKKDMLEVFRKYLEIEEEGVEFNLDAEKENMGLSINIPIKKVRGSHKKA